MRRSKKLEPMSIRLEPDVKAELQGLADADDRSLSAYINRVLRQHVEATRKRSKLKSGDK
jgi:predicted transcriptional regulator